MKAKHVAVIGLVIGLFGLGPAAQPAGAAPTRGNTSTAQSVELFERDGADTSIAERAKLDATNKRVRAVIDADRRVPALVADWKKAVAIESPARRKAALDALAPRILAIRADIRKKVAIDPSVASHFTALTRPKLHVSHPVGSSIVTKSESFTSFPSTWTWKYKCPDSDDTWDFDGKKVKAHAGSAMFDSDCWGLKAGRTITTHGIQSAKTMTITFTGTYTLSTTAVALGAYAHAETELGVIVRAPDGGAILSTPSGGTPIPAIYVTMDRASATNVFTNPLPFDVGNASGNLQPGDAKASVTIALPANRTTNTFTVTPIVRGMVDADVSGAASFSSSMTPTALKVDYR
jgi:hypothetical protein